jgi:hypothetical protein
MTRPSVILEVAVTIPIYLDLRFNPNVCNSTHHPIDPQSREVHGGQLKTHLYDTESGATG